MRNQSARYNSYIRTEHATRVYVANVAKLVFEAESNQHALGEAPTSRHW